MFKLWKTQKNTMPLFGKLDSLGEVILLPATDLTMKESQRERNKIVNYLTLIFVLVLLLVLSACAGAKARKDGAPSAIDSEHNTLLLELDVDGKQITKFGQVQWSYATGEKPKGRVTIHTPLPGTITMVGPLCGVDRRDYHPDKGGSFQYDLSEVIEHWNPDITLCAINVHVQWELPKGLTSEYPLDGMIGKIYLRWRPDNKAPMHFGWSPSTAASGAPSPGIEAAQFRAYSSENDEPIRIEASIPEPVVEGLFTLYGCGNGVQNVPFAGTNIIVSRETLLGVKADKGSCILQGRLVGKTADGRLVTYDGIVAAHVFAREAMKLSAAVTVQENKVCYNAEDTVSLVVMNYGKTNEGSFELEHCFNLPADGKARLGFFTVKGRALYAKIEGGVVTYWQ